MTETATTAEPKTTKSIIDPKYAARYKTTPKDWCATFIDERVKTTVMKDKVTKVVDEDGTETTKTESVSTGKAALNLESLFKLARANHIDTKDMEAQADRKNAPGRIRMTLGNSLRAASKHRHGLYDIEGVWHDAPEDYLGDAPKVQNPDGTKIVVAKPPAPAATETEAA